MIPVDRNRQINGQPIHPGAAWQARADAETAVARHERGEHEAKAGIYADNSVRAALEALTHFKCAYCEIFLVGFDWDVEHFRPKGRVTGRENDHPGYYWLAYEWTNLLPSCTHCNQSRKEKPVFGAVVVGDTGGKADQFPIADEAKRAMDHNGDITLEECLLINPCNDDPAQHLGYLPDGEMFALNGSRMGQTSIDVFRLNLYRRKEVRKVALVLVKEMLETRKAVTQRDPAAAELFEGMLKTLTADNVEFAGLRRYFVKDPAALGVV